MKGFSKTDGLFFCPGNYEVFITEIKVKFERNSLGGAT